ncbi:MAG: histidine kinase [Oligoflexales bacterium]
MNDWNGYTSLIKQLQNSDKVASRIAWSSKFHTHRIFHMKISDQKNYLISVEDKETSFSVIDEFIKELMVENLQSENISNIKLFDSDGYPIHFEAAKVSPDQEIVQLLQKNKPVLEEKSAHGIIEHLIPIDQESSEYYRNIRAIKITYDKFDLLIGLKDHKIVVITVIAIYLLLCGILAKFLSGVLVRPIKTLQREVEKCEENESRINYEIFHLNEVKSLAKSFVNLVEKLKTQKKDIENLAKENIRIQEQERQRIAMDLHDSVGQTLSAINITLVWTKKTLKSCSAISPN